MKMSDVLPSRSVFNPILKEMAQSPYIALFEWDDAKALADENTIRFFYEGDDLVGIGAWQPIDTTWCELGLFYVPKALRGKGYGNLIIQRIMTITKQHQQFAITKNPAAKHIFDKSPLQEADFFQLPRVIHDHLAKRVTIRRVNAMFRKLTTGGKPTVYISSS